MLLSNPKDQYSLSTAISCTYDSLQGSLLDRSIWKLQIDTYYPEMVRYGWSFMERSETVFYLDSSLLLECLENQTILHDDQVRSFLGMKNCDQWLSSFNMNLDKKLEFCRKMLSGFEKSFGKEYKIWIDQKYRENREGIWAFMESRLYDEFFNQRNHFVANEELEVDLCLIISI